MSWNTAGRRTKQHAQLSFLGEHSSDLITLQEVTANTAGPMLEALAAAGLPHAVTSFDGAADLSVFRGPRRFGQIIAARWPLRPLPRSFEIPWPERVTSAVLQAPFGEVEVYTTHVPPGSSNGWVMVETLEGLYRGLAARADRPRILTGDFNLPQAELADGTVYSWAYRPRRAGGYSLRGDRGQRWDSAELAVLKGLAQWGLTDVYRLLEGPERDGCTWYTNHGKGTGRRFDHVYAAEELRPARFTIHDEARRSGLSDHAAVEVNFLGGVSLPKQADEDRPFGTASNTRS